MLPKGLRDHFATFFIQRYVVARFADMLLMSAKIFKCRTDKKLLSLSVLEMCSTYSSDKSIINKIHVL